MIANYIFVALSATLALQIQSTLAIAKIQSGDDLYDLLTFGAQIDEKLPSAAEDTVNTVLRHIKFMLVNPNSSKYIRTFATNLRKVVTNEFGAKNIELIAQTVGYFLRNENSAMLLANILDEFATLAMDDHSIPRVLAAASVEFKRVLSEPKALETTEAFIDGINLWFDGVTPETVVQGLKRLKTVANVAKHIPFRKAAPSQETQTSPNPQLLAQLPRTGSKSQITRSNSYKDEAANTKTIEIREISSIDDQLVTFNTLLDLIEKNQLEGQTGQVSNININI